MLNRSIVERMGPNQMLSCYLTSAYCYYHLNLSPLTDDAFDTLALQLLAVWDKVDHVHKHLVTVDELLAGTHMLAEDKYPSRIRGPFPVCKDGKIVRWVNHAAEHYYEMAASGELAKMLEPHLKPVGYVASQASRGQLDLFERKTNGNL